MSALSMSVEKLIVETKNNYYVAIVHAAISEKETAEFQVHVSFSYRPDRRGERGRLPYHRIRTLDQVQMAAIEQVKALCRRLATSAPA